MKIACGRVGGGRFLSLEPKAWLMCLPPPTTENSNSVCNAIFKYRVQQLVLTSIYFTICIYLFCIYMGAYSIKICIFTITQVFIIQFLEVRKLSSENIL